jgi:hypothetical protein
MRGAECTTKFVDGGFVRNVDMMRFACDAQSLDLCRCAGQPFIVDVKEGDIRALCCKGQGNGPA